MKNLIIILAVFTFLISVKTTLADHVGDFYDNRDSNHAKMDVTPHVGLTYMSSGSGLQTTVIPDKVVFGNASLAVTTGDYWGSMPRVYVMRSQYGMSRDYQLYINNNAYWYPEHRDHDAVDYYFGMTPTLNISQGSSGSELDEMNKWFYTLNAFKSDTKSFLVNNKLIVPTMQYLARRSRVASDSEYLTSLAHINAFDNANNQNLMIEMAAQMEASQVPPVVKIKVISEDYDLTNDNYIFFEPLSISSEKKYEIPVSIARIFYGRQYTKKMIVSAEDSYDANNLDITYHWSVLRGDPTHVRITPQNSNNSQVEIAIDYHSETVIGESTRLSSLVVVGAFVSNAHNYSAPAFVTSYTKRNETREYDDLHKIKKITYNANYIDPTLSDEKSWQSDTFLYDSSGNLTGWQRLQDGQEHSFTKEGFYVEEKNSVGDPILASKVTYSTDSATSRTVWQTSGEKFAYPITVPDTDDTTPPVLSNPLPTGTLAAGTDNTIISINTDEKATCKYATTPNLSYSAMPITLSSTLDTTHFKSVSGLTNGQTYNYYLKCIDTSGNTNTSDYIISFSVSSPVVTNKNRFDVNNDDSVTTTDALLTLRNSLGLSMTSTAWQLSATTGDVNCDGVSNSTDALLILRYSLGLSMSETGWCE